MLLLSAYRRRAATINRRNTKNPFALRGKPLFPYYSCPSAKGQQTTRPSRRSTACRTSGARMPYTICTSQPFCTTPLQGRAFRACSLTKAGSFTVTRRRVKQLSTVRMFSRPPKAAMSFSTPCSSSGQGLFRPGRLFRAAARCGQVQRLDEHSEHHKIHRDLGKAQQIQHRVVRAGRTSGKVHHKRPQKVRGKRRDSAQVQQHDEAAGDGCVRQPQNRCREAEQKIQRLRNGSQRCRKGQRQQLKGSLFAAAPPGTEDECRRI